VELTVLDNGRGAVGRDETHEAQTAGYGLLGMRERVALLCGTVMAGPGPAQGWRVEVVIPLTPLVAHMARDEARDEGV